MKKSNFYLRFKKHNCVIILFALVVALLIPAGDLTAKSKKKDSVKVKKIVMNTTSQKLLVGEAYTRIATVKPKKAQNKKIKYTSSNKSVATVDANTGKVTAKKAGTVTITARATDGSKKYKKYSIKVETAKLSKTSLKLVEDSSYQISLGGSNTSTVSWSSSDKDVATVDANGFIKAEMAGTATIKAKVRTKTYSCTVTVASLGTDFGDYQSLIKLSNVTYMSDHTFIGDDLYVINAADHEHYTYAKAEIYTYNEEDKKYTNTGSIRHNLGHVNTLDYSELTDSIITGNGVVDETNAKIFVLDDIKNRKQWNFSDCTVIDVTKEGFGIKVNALWGEEPDICYVITNDNMNIHKLKLTRTDGKLDGGYEVLGGWEAEKSYDVNQGMCFKDGVIYEAVGHSQLRVIANELNDDGTIAQYELKQTLLDEDGQWLTKPFMEGIAYHDGCFYVGGSDKKIRVYKE